MSAPAPNERQNPAYVEDPPAAHILIAHTRRLHDNNRMLETVMTYQKVINAYPFQLISVEVGDTQMQPLRDGSPSRPDHMAEGLATIV